MTDERPASSEPAIAVQGLWRSYGERPALRDVAFSVPAGGTLAIIGPNGAGKSTLLRILATLLRPGEGSVRVLGAQLPGSGWRVRGRIGLLGHEPLLYPDLTARENLRFHSRLHGLTPASAQARIDWLLDRIGLSRRADDRVGELSRGMIQRLAVARALVHDPELLLLDEPLAALDPGAAESISPLLGPNPGRTRVLVTHDPERGVAGSDALLALDRRGQVAWAGPTDQVPDAAPLASLYAGTPR